MPFQTIQTGFAAGEVSPSLYGRTDLAKYHQGAFTMRNAFVNYRGGAASRAGTAFVGMCLQAGTSAPPRDIPFQFSITQGYALEFGDAYMRIKSQGAYVTEGGEPILHATNADPAELNVNLHGYNMGDWIYITGMQGLTSLNGQTFVVSSVPSADLITLQDVFGYLVSTIGSGIFTGGGTTARVYTVTSPYAAVDLPYLKFTQSADTMTLTCVNTATSTEYPSYELERFGATDWVFTQDTFAASIGPPSNVQVTAQSSTTTNTWYSYCVTAVSAATGEESVASTSIGIENNDISIYAGSNTVTWTPSAGASSYNVYGATPSYNIGVPVGSSYGYLGTAYGSTFTDSNITADFTQVPPTHQNPFARGAITAVTPLDGGNNYAQGSIGYTINTSTGSGFSGSPIVIDEFFVGFIITNGGQGYRSSDTIAITSSASGTGAVAVLAVGPESGTYPGTVAYYQERRVYAATLNSPDTYYMSQPGAFANMDSSIPITDSDAIIGTPWAQQVNGVQFMVPMPGGLVVLTGKGAWQLNGGNSAALTPADQDANPQAYNGCNDIVPPIVINYDILYLQAKGSIFRDLSYNFFVNIYTGTDLTVLSNHLFSGYTFSQWCWAEEPYKLAWAIRNDGAALSLTYLKEQDVYAWARHDTNGQFAGVCSITEPPVDAVYFITRRFVRGQWVYYSERMDNRQWATPEDCWCVDAGLAYPVNYPNATLSPAASTGSANIGGVNLISGGAGYTAPVVIAVDPTGVGSGAAFSVTLSLGAITGIVATVQGQNYAQGTSLLVTDPTGSGAIAQPIITNVVTFGASVSAFYSASVGDVIRVGGGIAVVTEILTGQALLANITQPITATVPNDPNNMPMPAPVGSWSISTPVTIVSGLNHLEGLTASIVADGSVVPSQVVSGGSITLPYPASQVLVGLGYTVQVQTGYLDPQGQQTAQGKRKNVYSVTARVEASRGFQVGTNQPDAATQPGGNPVPWANMVELKERDGGINAGAAIPLYTGDSFINVSASWQTEGQIAVQQTYPLPLNLLAVVASFQLGDTSA